jgi:hypothetical protein
VPVRHGASSRPLALALALAFTLGGLSSCRHAAPSTATAPAATPARAFGRSGASHKAPSSIDPPGALVADYSVVYDGHGELRVEAELERLGSLFAVESGAEKFVSDFEVAAGDASWTSGGRSGRSFVAQACERSPAHRSGKCRIRYRFHLRDAGKALEDLDVASEENEVIEAPPSTWLLAPEAADAQAKARFRVQTSEKTTFVTGVLRSRERPGAWDIAIGDLWTAPYSAFGPMRTRTVEVGMDPSAQIELAIAPGKLTVTDDEIALWVSDAARAVRTYFDRYPLPEALVLIVPSRGRWVGEGKTLSGGGGAIFMRVGERTPVRALREDWVLVHEMTHLAFPSVAREHDWAEEGLATYVEPFARARSGLMKPEDAWHSLVDGLPNGLPATGDRGLDRTPTWGRTYWGGALFYLLADLEIRKRTKNRLGLEHALRGVLAAGGNNAHRWALDDAFAAGDAAVGVPVLRELHESMGTSPHPVDLEALWRELGVVRVRGSVRFDDSAPLSAVRRAITNPP